MYNGNSSPLSWHGRDKGKESSSGIGGCDLLQLELGLGVLSIHPHLSIWAPEGSVTNLHELVGFFLPFFGHGFGWWAGEGVGEIDHAG